MTYINTTMLKSTIEQAAAAHPECALHVTDAQTGTLRPIYADTIFNNMIANPLLANDSGVFPSFFVPDGRYNIEVRNQSGDAIFLREDLLIRAGTAGDIAFAPTGVGELLGNGLFSYEGTAGDELINPDEIIHIYETGSSFRVLPSDAAQYHLLTGGGVKLDVLPGAQGYNIKAFNPQSAADYQAAVDKLPEGSTLHHPKDWSLDFDDGIVIGKRLRLTGGGLLNFTAGIAQKAGLRCTASGCEFIGLRLANPNELQSATGERNYGIEVLANEVLVQGCEIDRFQNGIAVRSTGEFHNHRIIGNRVKDCIGAGGGADDPAAQQGLGEDRGDGIVVWGAQALIQGNIVNAKPGQDCRVGIHAEGLVEFAQTSAPHSDAMVQITGNVIYGPFRRGIVNENIRGFSATANLVADVTWWALASVEGAENSTFSGNSVIWTRTSEGNQGASWAPVRAPLAFFGTGCASMMNDNTIWATSGSEMTAVISVEGPSDTRKHLYSAARGNQFHAEDNSVTVTSAGLRCSGHTDGFVFSDNILKGRMLRGANIPNSQSINITLRGNLLESPDTGFSLDGIRHNGPMVRISGNELRGFTEGIEASNASGGWVRENAISGGIHGINLFGSSGVDVSRNHFDTLTGNRLRNVGNDQARLVTGNGDQTLYRETDWTPGSIAAGAATSQTITVSDASLGDRVEVICSSGIGAGLLSTASVTDADTVTVTLFNGTNGTINPGNGTWRLSVERRGSYA